MAHFVVFENPSALFILKRPFNLYFEPCFSYDYFRDRTKYQSCKAKMILCCTFLLWRKYVKNYNWFFISLEIYFVWAFIGFLRVLRKKL